MNNLGVIQTDRYEDLFPKDAEFREASPELVRKYEQAIRDGNLSFISEFLDLYPHVDVPVLNLPSLQMLEQANHDALLYLDDKEYTVLPDIARAIVYDEPFYLHVQDVTPALIYLIFKYDSYEIYLNFKNEILAFLRRVCTTSGCRQYTSVLHDRILGDLMKIPALRNIYAGSRSELNDTLILGGKFPTDNMDVDIEVTNKYSTY